MAVVSDLSSLAIPTTSVQFSVQGAGGQATETMMTMYQSKNLAATVSGTSFLVPAGKRFRIQSINFIVTGSSTATATTTNFYLRVNAAGAATTAASNVVNAWRVATTASAYAYSTLCMSIPDGFDMVGDGTAQWGISQLCTYATNAPSIHMSIFGYEF